MVKINFTARRKARRLALQALYGWTISQNTLSEIETYVIQEHAKEIFDKEYFLLLLHQVPAQLEIVEKTLAPFLARALAELDLIELNILRIAAYELLFLLEIPYKVIINEALELTKTFGAKDSFKFVNGVLDKMAAQVRSQEV